jgi:hypothetical protein
MDIILKLESDHRAVARLFSLYEKDHALIVPLIATALQLHSKIEEKIVYPLLRANIREGADRARHAREEHEAINGLVQTLSSNPNDTRTFTALKLAVEHHVREEELTIFSELRDALSAEQLVEMGERALKMT